MNISKSVSFAQLHLYDSLEITASHKGAMNANSRGQYEEVFFDIGTVLNSIYSGGYTNL